MTSNVLSPVRAGVLPTQFTNKKRSGNMFHKGQIKSVSAGLAMTALALSSSAAFAVSGDISISQNLINSSPLWADAGPSYHACNVMNITTSTFTVKVDVLDSSGNTLATSGASPITLAGGGFTEVAAGGYTGFARCRVLVGANPINVRANLSVFHYTGTYYETLSTSEVR